MCDLGYINKTYFTWLVIWTSTTDIDSTFKLRTINIQIRQRTMHLKCTYEILYKEEGDHLYLVFLAGLKTDT